MALRSLLFSVTVYCVTLSIAMAGGDTASAPSTPILDPHAVLASAKEVTLANYPDAENVLVSEHVRTEYQSDGSFASFDDFYLKVLTERGRRSAREKEFSYNVFYGGLEILAAEVYKADGKVVRYDPRAISKEQVDRSQMEENIYDPNDKTMVAAVQDVEIGDVIRFFVKRWESKPRMRGCYTDWSVLEDTDPVKEITYEYLAPKDRPLQSKALLGESKGTVTATEQAEGRRIRYTWTGRNIPRVFPEPDMPLLATVGQRLLVSTVADWKDVSRWYYNICKGHIEKTTPELKAKTRALIKHAKTEDEKIRAIFKFVSQEIRYMGITTEQGSPGYEPHDVKITFENRYGVCRDKAALLAAMLQEAGVPAFPVLIMVGEKLDREVPSSAFNHAITAARAKDGKYILMDSTNENTSDLMPQYLYNRSYLVATPEGETLMTSPVSPVEDNMAMVRTDVRLADDGSANGTTVIDMHGINDVDYRDLLAESKPEDMRRFFEGEVKSMLAGAAISGFKLEPEDIQDSSRNLRVSINWSVPSILVTGGDTAQLDLPFAGYDLSLAMRIIGKSLQLDKRRFPLNIDMTCGVHEDLSVTLPSSLAKPISLPRYDNTEHRDFSINQTIRAEAGVLRAALDIRLKSPTVAPADYIILKQAMAKLQSNRRQKPVFFRQGTSASPAPVTADVEVLNSRLDVRVGDGSTWTTRQEVKKKILSYRGTKSNSELKLDFNPAWETVEVEYARVTQNDGTVRTIQPQEMNILDAAWVASAPRYPGAKTLVVSLPGVEVGSIIEYAIRQSVREQPMFQSAYAFASRDMVKDMEFHYDLPEHLNPQLVMDFPAEGHVTDEVRDGRRHLAFTWHDIRPRAEEKDAPPDWADAPDFGMSTGKWPGYAMAVSKQLAPLMDHQSACASKAGELVAGLSDPMAKLTAIRDFVARQIRHAAPAFTDFPLAAAFSPPDVTLRDGYGHAADCATLLHALLKSAGFDPQLALASGNSREPAMMKRGLALPENGYFNQLVCRVKHPITGEWLPLDQFSQYAPPGVTALDGEPGYTLDGEPFTWAAPAAMRDLDDTRLALDIDTEGTALITVTKHHHGIAHQDFVAKYSEMSPEERKRDFQGLVSDISRNATPQGELITDFTYPGTLTYTVRVERFGVKTGKGLYFDLPEMPEEMVEAESNHRRRALLVADASRVHIGWVVTAPGGLKPIIQPEALDWGGPGNFGTIRFTRDADQTAGKTRLIYNFDRDTNPALIPTGNYPAILELNRHFGQSAARRIFLR